MTYYEHATAMAFKLDRWGEERPLRNYELDALANEQRTSAVAVKKQSLFMRCVSVIRSRKSSDSTDTPSASKGR